VSIREALLDYNNQAQIPGIDIIFQHGRAHINMQPFGIALIHEQDQ
jgi:hypothetical protein